MSVTERVISDRVLVLVLGLGLGLGLHDLVILKVRLKTWYIYDSIGCTLGRLVDSLCMDITIRSLYDDGKLSKELSYMNTPTIVFLINKGELKNKILFF